MIIAGSILSILGLVMLMATAIGITSVKSEDEFTAADALDLFVLGGMIGFLYDLFHGIKDGIRNRSSPTFPLIVFFGVSVGMVLTGVTFLITAIARI